MTFYEEHFKNGTLPAHISILHTHNEELSSRTGWRIHDVDTTPWNHYIHADSDAESLASHAADVQTNAHIAYIMTHSDDEYLGFWLGPEQCHFSKAPVVYYDKQGLYELIGADTIVDALVDLSSWDDTLIAWFDSVGLTVNENPSIKPFTQEPDEFAGLAYQRLLAEKLKQGR